MNQPLTGTLPETIPHPTPIIGLAAIARLGFSGTDLQPLWRKLVSRATGDLGDVGALLDLSIIELIAGRRDNRLTFQAQALSTQRLYRLAPALETATPLRLLAFMAPGDFMANTPIEFLLEGSNVRLDILYVSPGQPLPDLIPAHDLAFVAIAESEEHRPLLEEMRAVAANWPVPVVNAPHLIERLTRDGAYALLRDVPGLSMPPNIRVGRAQLREIAEGEREIGESLPECGFPMIVRPLSSHGGEALKKLSRLGDLKTYLATRTEDEFYVAPFIDYQGSDGLYRKYRIALVDGRAYGCHLAISRHWMVHYLNADMPDNPANRGEEDRFLTQFDADFGLRHSAALAAISERTELDYAIIDCAETADGQLLLFEIGTAMIVHSMDPADVFPYKKAAMEKVFAGFIDMLRARSGCAEAASPDTIRVSQRA
ncbi:MAG TPA: hypothetical protein VIJ06_02525 [Methylovirgula sp.]